MANWSVSTSDIAQRSITINWPDLSVILDQLVLHYIGFIKDTNGNISSIVTGNARSVTFHRLSPYRKYYVSVVGITGNGKAYKSAEVMVRTEEGGMY